MYILNHIYANVNNFEQLHKIAEQQKSENIMQLSYSLATLSHSIIYTV